MIKRFIPKIGLLLLLFGFANLPVLAQEEKKTEKYNSYEVVLQVLIGSNESKDDVGLPDELKKFSDSLKKMSGLKNYRVLANHYNLVSENKGFTSNSIIYNQDETNSLIYNNYEVLSFSVNSEKQKIMIGGFKYRLQVPLIRVIEDKKIPEYAMFGVSSMFSLSPDEPTLVGTFSTKKDEQIFLVLTVKPEKNN